jgi:hypothetical protein
MRTPWRYSLALLLLGVAGLAAWLPGPARAVAEGDEPEPAHRPAPRWPEDGEVRRRLKDEWRAFHKLPRKQQERLKLLDDELNDEPPAGRARLWAALYRYSAWLDRLDEKDRRQIESAPDATKKLEVIKALREAEWVAHLPKADRDRIEAAAPAERAALIASFRQKEHERRAQWQLALRQQGEAVPPGAPADLWPRIRQFEERSLIPTLTQAEREELFRARRAAWPEHARVLSALAEKHAIQVPPAERNGVTSLKDVPESVKQALVARPGKPKGDNRPLKELRELQGRWPNFALALDRMARNRKVTLPDRLLGPCRQEEFLPIVQRFIEELRKDPAAAKKLDEAQGKWPDYPFAVMELAKERKRQVPGTFLPGSKKFWEQAKAAAAKRKPLPLRVQFDVRIVRDVDPHVHVREPAEVPHERRPLQAPVVPLAVVADVSLLVEGQAAAVQPALALQARQRLVLVVLTVVLDEDA